MHMSHWYTHTQTHTHICIYIYIYVHQWYRFIFLCFPYWYRKASGWTMWLASNSERNDSQMHDNTCIATLAMLPANSPGLLNHREFVVMVGGQDPGNACWDMGQCEDHWNMDELQVWCWSQCLKPSLCASRNGSPCHKCCHQRSEQGNIHVHPRDQKW